MNKLIYEQDHESLWELPIDKIKLIGEYTTSTGPINDDYFFVFAVQEIEWFEAPATAIDHQSFWGELGQKLGARVHAGLANSVTWMTRVMYPTQLEGQELFEIKEDKREQPLWNKIIRISSDKGRLAFTDDVQKLLKQELE